MRHLVDFSGALLIAVMFSYALAVVDSNSTPEVKYCIDLRTGEVITVRANMPCPYPTTEL